MTQSERAEQRALLLHIRRDAHTLARDFELPLRSVDVYRREAGVWNQAGSNINVIATAED